MAPFFGGTLLSGTRFSTFGTFAISAQRVVMKRLSRAGVDPLDPLRQFRRLPFI